MWKGGVGGAIDEGYKRKRTWRGRGGGLTKKKLVGSLFRCTNRLHIDYIRNSYLCIWYKLKLTIDSAIDKRDKSRYAYFFCFGLATANPSLKMNHSHNLRVVFCVFQPLSQADHRGIYYVCWIFLLGLSTKPRPIFSSYPGYEMVFSIMHKKRKKIFLPQ